MLAEVSVYHAEQPGQGLIFSFSLFPSIFWLHAQNRVQKPKAALQHMLKIFLFILITTGYSQDKEAESDEYFFQQEGK